MCARRQPVAPHCAQLDKAEKGTRFPKDSPTSTPRSARSSIRSQLDRSQEAGQRWKQRIQLPTIRVAIFCLAVGIILCLLGALLAGDQFLTIGIGLIFPGAFAAVLALVPTDSASIRAATRGGAVSNFVLVAVFVGMGATTGRGHIVDIAGFHDDFCQHDRTLTLQTLECPSEAAYFSRNFGFALVSFVNGVRQALAYHHNIPPRAALELLWSLGGIHSFLYGVCSLAYSVAIIVIYGFNVPMHLPRLLVTAETLALGVIASRPRVRVMVQAYLASRGGACSSAVGIAALLGGRSTAEVQSIAFSLLRSVSAELLTAEDMARSTPDLTLYKLTKPASPHTIDCFLSHSWSDDPGLKWAALQEWRRQFKAAHGREPLLFVDKYCMDSSDLATSLMCLPVFLASCNELIILAGETYLLRLWCVVEVFCFLEMGGQADMVHLVPVGHSEKKNSRTNSIWEEEEAPLASAADERAATPAPSASPTSICAPSPAGSRVASRDRSPAEVNRRSPGRRGTTPLPSTQDNHNVIVLDLVIEKALENFDAREAKCTLKEDEDRLLSMIESAFGDMPAFNQAVRDMFKRVLASWRARQKTPDRPERRDRTFHSFLRHTQAPVSSSPMALSTMTSSSTLSTSSPANGIFR